MGLFDEILRVRGILPEQKPDFLSPRYDYTSYDPFLLNDMEKAVARIKAALGNQEKVIIYGDYDIDGLSATALLLDALKSFGFTDAVSFIPSRFVDGYGLSVGAVEAIAKDGASLIITVDTGSLNHKEIARAGELGVDVIVTDHHNLTETLPPAVAVINPKRVSDYPFKDLSAVGVTFKLVQALQSRIDGLPKGQEKWLLDLVALGTICDIVSLTDENRMMAHFGLKVIQKTRRPGLKALMAVAGITSESLDARAVGFGIGPRLNAAGRLETAKHALDVLLSGSPIEALEKANLLNDFNQARRLEQAEILKSAREEAAKYATDSVLVLSHPEWNHGIIGIVATKLLEEYKKPVFILQKLGDESKGSARSYGDFSAAEAIKYANKVITKGGGHKLAAGVTLPTKNIPEFRKLVNEYYKSLALSSQSSLLLPIADVVIDDFSELTEDLWNSLRLLEPFGQGNPEPILQINDALVVNRKILGKNRNHVKLELKDKQSRALQFLAFNAPESYFIDSGERATVWFTLTLNDWNGYRSIEGRILHIENNPEV